MIEDLIEINSKLSTWNLIYVKYDWKWKIIIIILSLFVFGLVIFGVYNHYQEKIFNTVFFYIIALAISFYLVKFIFKKRIEVIKKRYNYVTVSDKKKVDRVIDKIKVEEFKKLVNSDFSKEKVVFIIESIKRDNESNGFGYPFIINFIIITVGVYFSSFISGFATFFINEKDVKSFLSFYQVLAGLILTLFVIVSYFEITIFKDFTINKRKNRNILLRILENIYLEKYS